MASAAKKTEDSDDHSFQDELKPGTKLLHGQYTIESFLNSGGFGITYLAKDSLDRKVVIKECFTGAFCRRSETIVGARSRAHQAEFRSIVKLFVQEARSLAKLDHPNIVGVHQVFEDNDTAYMALDFVEGFDLMETLEEGGEKLPADQVTAILEKILDAIGFIHDQSVLHRDISPDNILLDKNTNSPVLIDFGAAREEATKASRVLSAMRVVKDGYSPQEFYINGSAQSPSSDLYALGATFYHLISGDTPPNSQARLAAIAANDPDPYVPLGDTVSGYDEDFTNAIDKALNVFPKDRIQSAADWLEMISPEAREKAALKRAQSDESIDDAVAKVVSIVPSHDNSRPTSERSTSVASGLASAETGEEKKGFSPKIAILMATAASVAIIAGLAITQFGGGETAVTAEAPQDVIAQAPVVTETTTTETVTEIAANEPVVIPEADGIDTSPVPAQRPETVVEETVEVVDAAPVETPALDGVTEQTVEAETQATDAVETPPVIEIAEVETGPITDPVEEIADFVPPEIIDPVEEEIANFVIPEPAPEVLTSFLSPFRKLPGFDALQLETGEALDSDVAILQPTELSNVAFEVAAVVDKVPAVFTPVVQELELSSVMSGWSVGLPFSSEGGAEAVIANLDQTAAEWMQKGQRIVEVNGRAVASFSDISPVLRATVTPGDAEQVEVIFGVEPFEGADIVRKTASLPLVRETVLLNGLQFQTRNTTGGVETVVTSAPEDDAGELQVGDVIVAYMATAEKIDVDITLADILSREVAKDIEQFNFAVRRDDSMWVASFKYKTEQ